MAIEAVCACGAVMAAADGDAGRTAACLACGRPVTVPAPPTVFAPRPKAPPPVPVDLEVRDRVAALERSNRRLSYGLTAASVTAAALASVPWLAWRPPAPPARPVTGTAFVLADAAGVARGEWGLDADGTAFFSLNDAAGNRAARVFAGPAGACGVHLMGGGRTRAALAVAGGGPSLVLWDAAGAGAGAGARVAAGVADASGRAWVKVGSGASGDGAEVAAGPDGSVSFDVFGPDAGVRRAGGLRDTRFGLLLDPQKVLSFSARGDGGKGGLMFRVDRDGRRGVVNFHDGE